MKEILVGVLVIAPAYALFWLAPDVVILGIALACGIGTAWMTGTLILAFWPWRKQ